MPDSEDCRRADHLGQYASKKGQASRARPTFSGDRHTPCTSKRVLFGMFRGVFAGSNVAQAYAAMTPYPFVFAASLLAIQPANAFQNEVADQAAEVVQVSEVAGRAEAPQPRAAAEDQRRTAGSRDRGNNPQVGGAVERGDRPRGDNQPTGQAASRESRPAPAPAPAPAPVRVEQSQPQPATANDQRRNDGGRDRGDNPQSGGAVQRGDRPRGDNPATGRAVPRDTRSAPAPARPQDRRSGGYYGNGGRNIYVAPPTYNYYYYPRRYYPYGYGAFGLGYFYYDPYTWYPPSYYGGYDNGYGGYYGGYFDEGEVRLSVSPRSADVYVDGYYAGRVDDFDGVFQALKLESGAHHIQIVAPGYTTLDFDVRINPGQKITYRGDLRPLRP